MVWKYEKFKGDGAIYAFCPKCNFHHNPSEYNIKTGQTDVIYQYNYCPMCAEPLYDENGEIEIIWNERNIAELYSKNL